MIFLRVRNIVCAATVATFAVGMAACEWDDFQPLPADSDVRLVLGSIQNLSSRITLTGLGSANRVSAR